MTFREYIAKRIDRAGPDALCRCRVGEGRGSIRVMADRQGISITDTPTAAMPLGRAVTLSILDRAVQFLG
jgi:hypothetical protein